ncbi:uncharacterized protein LOC108601042 isoform X2 [Drosophila busckii]|uniref:uncharacterized protein LOC108601042 isoform X2 n=1 Tax=Drosophila busckii TaxID=30019 RepID=UPI00083F0C43|nr:uncharacterized protein LOC108601042 isoform X2 [Drosophila busckii]
MSDAGGASSQGGYQKLPPGWDCKYDQTTGNCYYINYLTKAMQLEDPRPPRNYKQLQNERCSTESIAMQHLGNVPAQSSHHSSPFHVVYPSNNLTAVRAFQERERQQPALHNLSSSPLLSTSSRGQLVEMSSPLPFQRARLASHLSRRSTIQETSFSQFDTHAVVSKIQNMFPTADENHIRLLLKRYMKNIFPKADEMLLLDVLANADNNVQFASEKLQTLGYIKRDMQPHRPNNRPPQLTEEQQAAQELATQHIPLRPKECSAEEKTNLELEFKAKYPQIPERIILMALESVNYAEDRATQILQIVQDEDEQRQQQHAAISKMSLDCGQTLTVEQVDGVVPASKPHKQHRQLPSINVITPSTATTQIILPASQTPSQELEEPFEVKEPALPTTSAISSACSSASPAQSPTRFQRLTTKSILARSFCVGSDFAARSSSNSNYNNNNNNYSINGYLHGSNSNASTYSSYTTSVTSSASSITKAIENRARDKFDSLKQRQHSLHLDNSQGSESTEFQSLIERMGSLGPNSKLSKGADEHLLLADYVTWNGPNTALSQKATAHGPDASLLSTERNYKPGGRNSELCKGAKKDLAKGSIYAQSQNANIKCN